MDSEDRKRFCSTTGTVGSDISRSNCIGGFDIYVGCFDIGSRDLDATYLYDAAEYYVDASMIVLAGQNLSSNTRMY